MVFNFFVALFTSIIGSITGVGSGILMKPVLDLFSMQSVEVINLLSSITVFAMSFSAIVKEMKDKVEINYKTVYYLSVGSILGGIFGKKVFEHLRTAYLKYLSITQSAVFSFLMLCIIIYILNSKKIKSYKIEKQFVIFITGLILGVVSAFLGIGGGPLNVVLLIFLFSMSNKEASINSIFIIFFSQIASLIYGFIFHSRVNIQILMLFFTVFGGIVGGIAGRYLIVFFSEKLLKILFIISILFSFLASFIHLLINIF